jgi:hypothetical protein
MNISHLQFTHYIRSNCSTAGTNSANATMTNKPDRLVVPLTVKVVDCIFSAPEMPYLKWPTQPPKISEVRIKRSKSIEIIFLMTAGLCIFTMNDG